MKPNLNHHDLDFARSDWVTRGAVAAVVVAALGAALMVRRADIGSHPERAATASTATRPAATQTTAVVKAPPLKAMGGSAACGNCGTVEMVVAVHEHAKSLPSTYQMHIRMDDGSVCTVQQRGAMAAGSRVQVDGSSVRALSPQ